MTRTAQETLSQLEKDSAPIAEQVIQAAIFATVEILPLSSIAIAVSANNSGSDEINQTRKATHGRQEWVLRWTLKKLATSREERACAELWDLLRTVLDRVPRRNAARVLNERKFLGLVGGAIEELLGGDGATQKVAADEEGDVVMSDAPEIASKSKSKSKSKKRKRDGRLVESEGSNAVYTQEKVRPLVRDAIYGVMDIIVRLSRPASLEGEYIKSVLRTNDAAKILGTWLKLCQSTTDIAEQKASHEFLLKPFIEVWRARVVGLDQSALFSKYCVEPILSLLSAIGADKSRWKTQLEELLARNVIMHAKTAYGASSNTEILKGAVGEVLDVNPSFGVTLFDVAIRCIQPHPSKRRRPTDTAWLQAVFTLILESVAKSAPTSSPGAVITSLLRSCVTHQVTLDLPLLRSIVSQYAFTESAVDWSLISMILKVDSNVFLIPDPEEDLLKQLFSVVTAASESPSWVEIADIVIDDVVLALMGESAKARDLTGFVHKWYAQLVALEEKRGKSTTTTFSAWEDDALIIKLREVMEPSLTTEQITELVQWLEEKASECFEAVLVIADAVSGAITKEEIVDTIGLRLNSLAFFKKKSTPSCEHRPWRVATRTIDHASVTVTNDQWEEEIKGLSKRAKKYDLLSSSQKTLEILRCLSSMWCMSRPGSKRQLDAKLQKEVQDLLDRSLTQAFEVLASILPALKSGLDIGEEKWGQRVLSIERGAGWFACEYGDVVLVEYPEVLEQILETDDALPKIESLVWLASATSPLTAEQSSNSWLRQNHGGFPSIFDKALQSETLLNNKKITGLIITSLIACGSHTTNPIEPSPACNGFVVRTLLQIPVEVFSRRQRELVVEAWPASVHDSAASEHGVLSYRMTPLNPAVISLKMKIMHHPTFYEGIKFQDLVELGDCIATLGSQPRILLPIFAEFAKLTLGHVIATMEQPRSRTYLAETTEILRNWSNKNAKAKSTLSFAMTRLAQVTLSVLVSKADSLDAAKILSKEKSAELVIAFKKTLLANLSRLLEKAKKFKKGDDERAMSLRSSIDALEMLTVEDEDLEEMKEKAQSFISIAKELNDDLSMRVETFFLEHSFGALSTSPSNLLGGDLFSSTGRQSIQKMVAALTENTTEKYKLRLLAELLQEAFENASKLDKLLAVRHVIVACEDSRDAVIDGNDDAPSGGLSTAYSMLSAKLSSPDDFRQFCLIAEIMDLILKTKGRSITQYNIDSTLSAISIICTSSIPALPATHAATIYLHLTNLLQTILISHRLKLQGHFHLLVQTMQSLLVPLFTPLSPHMTKSHPSWLASPATQLTPIHASTYTRLLTLICDPSISTVSRPSSNTLNSATAKAKRQAGEHMPLVLGLYVQLQLDMGLKMHAEVREKLVQGIYAIFDTTSIEGRRVLGEGMDASGRAVLGGLVKDWTRFGKWKGS